MTKCNILNLLYSKELFDVGFIVGLAYIHTEMNFIPHAREHFWRIKLYSKDVSLLEVDCNKDFLRVSYV